jgi:hypothetical protein
MKYIKMDPGLDFYTFNGMKIITGVIIVIMGP